MNQDLLQGSSRYLSGDNVPTKHNHWIQTIVLSIMTLIGILIRQGNGIPVLAVLWFSGVFFEVLWSRGQKLTPFKDGTTALWLSLFQFLIPMDAPLIPLSVSILLGLYLSKTVLGGLGRNWINPVAMMFLFFLVLGGFETEGRYFDPWTDLQSGFRAEMNQNLQNGSGQLLGNRNSLDRAIDTNYSENIRGISDFVNNWFLGPLRIKVPTGYFHLAFSSRSATMGQLMGFWIFLLSIWFLARDLIGRKVVLGFVLAYLPLTFVLGDLPFSGEWLKGDVFFHLLAGNFGVSVFFILPLLGSLPLTQKRQFQYGLLAGGLSFATRLFLVGGDTLPLGILMASLVIPFFNDLSRKDRKLRENRL